jgi:Fe-S-cluster formation regulator IscX/YfhJ
MKPISECKTVAELLESPERWKQGNAWGAKDKQFAATREEATCFCVIGAIAYIYGDEYGSVTMKCFDMRKKLELIVGTHAIVNWNDDPNRTHTEVLEAVRKAGI